EPVARPACAAGQARDPQNAVHESQGTAAHPRTLGPAQNRCAGGLHRVDSARQAATSAAGGDSLRQITPGRCSRNVVITHPEKVLFPDDDITKGELSAYYEMIAPLMLPHIVRRPVTMERFPAGIGKKGFLQKDVSKGFPEWLHRVEVPKK